MGIGTAIRVLFIEVPLFQGVLIRGVPLYTTGDETLTDLNILYGDSA